MSGARACARHLGAPEGQGQDAPSPAGAQHRDAGLLLQEGAFHDLAQRIGGFLEGVAAAAELGHKEIDRLSLARERLGLKLKGRRSTSRLPDLVGLILSRPLISVPLAARELKVSPQAVEGMLKDLGTLRELTGRRRYRAWGIV